MALTPEVLVQRLGDMLVSQKLITDDQLHTALEEQEVYKARGEALLLGQVMIRIGIIDQAQLDQAITLQILQLQNGLKEANATLEERVQERTAELEEANRKLSVLNEMKSNFVSNISHELQTPLTHIIGYLDLMMDSGIENLNSEQKESLKVIKKASARLGHLIEDLILFSTSKAGKISLEKEVFDLVTLIEEDVEKANIVAQGKSIAVKVSSPYEKMFVLADRHKINWVINHLIENAIKFTPEGGLIKISISRDGDQVQTCVEDSGVGIEKESLTEIFEPFHQLDGSSTRKQGGTGLGLALVKKILEAHGQAISVISMPGKGSAFFFYLDHVENSD
jgi:signal transduction histidine kinase